MTFRWTRRTKVAVAILAFLIVFGAFALRQDLDVRRFDVTSNLIPAGSEITLVQLSDLHASNYGERQRQIIETVAAIDPDAVLLTGDILDQRRKMDRSIELVEEVASRWPTFFSFGNHEFRSRNDEAFQQILETNGVTVLRGGATELQDNGAAIQIGGLDDPDVEIYRPTHESYSEQLNRLGDIIDQDKLTVILNHRPEQISRLLPMAPDIVLSGHAHGGQWRVPGILENGVFAPGQGFLPALTSGRFDFGETQLFVSRGLSKWAPPIPRVFNRPEIIVINIRASGR